MLSNNDAKLLRKLQRKKYRDQEEMFVAEGPKVIGDLIANGLKLYKVWSTTNWDSALPLQSISEEDLRRVSNFETPNQCIAVFEKPKVPSLYPDSTSAVVLFLDGIRDPGNMGTLIRLADWFGVRQIICSDDCVDVYNFKTVQSSMGSLGNVDLYQQKLVDLAPLFQAQGYTVCGTLLDGSSVYQTRWPEKTILVLGSESHGISNTVQKILDKKILIPQASSSKAESLNVAVAASICLGLLANQQN
ncbi:MAG: RNA methyltransferase [Schleiferiaceae bacterium]|nr:RNA methyltransferase [Schleiferiaceae bacterium]